MAREPEPELFQARVWRRLQCPGTTYTPRTGHTCVVWRHYVYVFGGTDKRRRQQDMYRFDLRAQVWEAVPARGDVPKRRSGATAAVVSRARSDPPHSLPGTNWPNCASARSRGSKLALSAPKNARRSCQGRTG